MREAHARNPQLRHAPAGRQKRCGHCGEAGHNRKTCPQLVAAREERLASLGLRVQPNEPKARGRGKAASPQPDLAPPASRVILIEEVAIEEVDNAQEGSALASLEPSAAAAAATSSSNSSTGTAAGTAVQSIPADVQQAAADAVAAGARPPTAAGAASADAAEVAVARAAAAATAPRPTSPKPQQPLQRQPDAAELLGGEGPLPYGEMLQTRWLAPGFSLDAEGGWVFSLPQSKEECVAQAAQVRAMSGGSCWE